MSGLIDEMIEHFSSLRAITADTIEAVGESSDMLLASKLKEVQKYDSYIKCLANVANLGDRQLNIPDVSNLLPCPFCGEKAETVKSGDTYTTMCMNQECSVMVQSEGDDKEESESIWNVRAR